MVLGVRWSGEEASCLNTTSIPFDILAIAIQSSCQAELLAFFPSSAIILLVVWSANGYIVYGNRDLNMDYGNKPVNMGKWMLIRIPQLAQF